MKKLNILFAGLAALGMSSCDDFLEVESPSAFDDAYVFENTTEASRLLNGVYASLASNSTFGNAFINTFDLNSDVEYYTISTEPEAMTATQKFYRQYQCTPDASDLKNTWDGAYQTIERASNFIAAAEQSDLYAAGDTTLFQLMGEAKCMRAMNFLELVIMMGDVPFDLRRTYEAEGLVKPIVDRDEILTTLINDLREIAPHMQLSSTLSAGVERCSKEFAWALIAKMALYRGGYSLRKGANPSDNGVMQRAADYKDYYQIARNYCDSVITKGGHMLNKEFYQVFIDECNYKVAQGDDPIFEIPFTMDVSGNIGYAQGPACSAAGSSTYHKWGSTNGGVRLNFFHRFTYASTDKRRDCIGFWGYTDAAVGATPSLLNTQSNYCNKWSKFWDYSARQGAESSGSTGINFPYMRYADVLLMFAEAENELSGPTSAAKSALKQVRERAFRGAANEGEMVDTYVDAATTKEAFFEQIFNERAWEFAGEGLRWKDLVRWNLLSKVVYQQFFKYFGFAANDYSYDMNDEFNTFPRAVYYKVVANPNKGAENYVQGSYPNNEFDVLQFFEYESVATGRMVNNLWEPVNFADMYDEDKPAVAGANAWTAANWGAWEDNNTGTANTGSRLGFVGYIYANRDGVVTANSRYTGLNDQFFYDQNWSSLPPVRYIMPLPEDAIARSEGQYKNYYGY